MKKFTSSKYELVTNLRSTKDSLVRKFVLFSYFVGIILPTAYCQLPPSKIDSILTLLKTDKEDTSKITHLNSLGWELMYDNPDTAIILSNRALSIAEKLEWKKGTANSLGQLGVFCEIKGDYPKALDYHFKALKIDEELNNKKGIAARLGNIGLVYADQADYPKALDYYLKALKIDEELGNKNGIATRLGNIGLVYADQADYSKALEYYLNALKMDEELGNKNGTARHLGNIGNVYVHQADYPKALNYYFKALKMNEEHENKYGIANWLGNIGSVYYEQSDYPKALDYLFKALKMDEEIGNDRGIAIRLSSIGVVYYSQSDYHKIHTAECDSLLSRALNYCLRALKMYEDMGIKDGIANVVGNIGNIYSKQADYPKALDYLFKVLKMDEELGDKKGIALSLVNIGSLYTSLGKYNDAYTYLYRALAISDSIGAKDIVKGSFEMLSVLYEKTTNPLPDSIGGKTLNIEQIRLRALHYFKSYMTLRDTIFSEENKKQLIRKEMTYQFEKKETAAKAEQEKKDAVAAEESKKQKIVIVSLLIGSLFVVMFLLFVYRSLRITKKQKRTIEEQKKAVDEKNLLLAEQKKIIEEKNKDITDSISYAKRIQNAILPPMEVIKKTLPECFVLYKPKDIVSGDFYWIAPPPPEGGSSVASFGGWRDIRLSPFESGLQNPPSGLSRTPSARGREGRGAVLFALADCTGHGVPGAFMSMIGSEKLNEAVQQTQHPGEILSLLNKGIKSSLHQSVDVESTRDGMDIALVKFQALNSKSKIPREDDNSLGLGAWDMEIGTCILQYAGANRPLWIIRNGSKEVQEIKATKKAIGGFTDDEQMFETHDIELNKGDTIYLFSDGLPDLFGGPQEKKLSTKRFKEILLKIQNLSMHEQEKYLSDFIERWKGSLDQVDDICVIGVRK